MSPDTKDKALSPHCRKVLEVLHKSAKPLSAYELLDKLRRFGIKAPPTVYRALETLVARGLAHRIETLNAFVACHGDGDEHGTQFAVCRACGNAQEIHDHRICGFIEQLGASLKFRVERPMLELMGLCHDCDRKAGT